MLREKRVSGDGATYRSFGVGSQLFGQVGGQIGVAGR